MESTSGRLAPGGQRPRAFRHDSSLWQVHRRAGSIRQHSRMVSIKAQGYDTQEPDWEEEMSIFKRRTLKPSQLEALRKLEAEKVDVGRVSWGQQSKGCACVANWQATWPYVWVLPPPPPPPPRLSKDATS